MSPSPRPGVIPGAIAARTARMTPGTAVTVLSTDDPLRLFQRFSTPDALAGGRAGIVAGRGSFTGSHGLFGHDLNDPETLFKEKLDPLMRLVRDRKATRSGSPESVLRAMRCNGPMMRAIIGGDPRRFRPFVDLDHRAHAQIGSTPQPWGVHSPGHIADTDAAARDRARAGDRSLREGPGRERGWGPPSRAEFDRDCDTGSMPVGAPETVARKIAATVRVRGLSRFEVKYSQGRLTPDAMMRSIELYGTRVMPMVQELLAAVPAPA